MAPPLRSTSGAGTLSSQASNYDEDVRFANLLKPIKDLTANWSVPLSNYLTQYHEELTQLEINLDGRTAKVNFAEAALFLQGTVSVYSKKVEFLWQNVLKMLDLLASKKALEEADNDDGEDAGDGTGRKRKGRGAIFDPNEFDLVGISIGKNTNLKSEVKESVHSRKMTLKFIFVTPRQLIEKESKEQKMTRIDLYVKSAGKYDLLGQKEEFRVNSQFALRTGMIGEELCAASDLAQQSVSLCDESDSDLRNSISNSFNNTLVPDPNSNPELPMDVEEEIVFQDDHLDQPPSPDPSPENELPNENSIDEDENLSPKKRKTTEDFLNEPKAPLEDTWQPVEPHEISVITKPLRRGRRKTTAAVVDVKKLSTTSTRSRRRGTGNTRGSLHDCSNNNELSKVSNAVESLMMQDLQKTVPNNIVVESNLAPAFIDEAISHIKSKSKTNLPAINELEDEEVQIPTTEDNDAQPNQDFDDFHLDNDDFDCDNQNFDSDDLTEKPTEKQQQPPDSYEDLVLKRVSEYVAQSQDYIQSTELAKRVRIWHENLGPKLEEVEKRGDFDIHAYGTQILDKFPEGNRKTTIKFQDVISESSPEEVSRLFLSSLMLANTQNLEIECTASKKEELPMDCMSLTLLSTQRHHEHMLESIPELPEQVKRKKSKKTKTLNPIPEDPEPEVDDFDDTFERQHRENLEAFDAIPVAQRGHEQVQNGEGVIFAIPSTSKSATTSRGKKKNR